jgi:hypothetical protein
MRFVNEGYDVGFVLGFFCMLFLSVANTILGASELVSVICIFFSAVVFAVGRKLMEKRWKKVYHYGRNNE